MVEIKLVRNQEDAAAVYSLAYEFIGWLRVRYPEMHTEIDEYLARQKFDEQIRDVLKHYGPPQGECLLAWIKGEPVGVLMLKDIGDGICEMNRMYVRDTARGLGAGRALVERLKERAIEMGFDRMILSALSRHHEALPLYYSLGFELDDREKLPGEPDNVVMMGQDLKTGLG